MNADPRPTHLRRRVVLVALLAVGMLTVAGVWWSAGADERRVDRACDTWLAQRAAMRTALDETDEAVGRAQAAHADRTADYFNDVDVTIGALDTWERASPQVVDELHGKAVASGVEASAVAGFAAVQEGVVQLRRLIEAGTPDDVGSWTAEVRARFQMVDDACLAAARAG